MKLASIHEINSAGKETCTHRTGLKKRKRSWLKYIDKKIHRQELQQNTTTNPALSHAGGVQDHLNVKEDIFEVTK